MRILSAKRCALLGGFSSLLLFTRSFFFILTCAPFFTPLQTDLCISNAIVKTGIGFSAGVLLSVLLFRRRSWPVWLGTGFGLGSGWTDCERSFNPVAIPGVRILPSPNHQSAPSSGSPSVMERLSAKTSDLVDTSKSKLAEAKQSKIVQDVQNKKDEAIGEAKTKAKELEDKVRRV